MSIEEIEKVLSELCVEHEEIEYSFYSEGSVLNSYEFDGDLDDYGYIHFLLFEEEGGVELLRKILENIEMVNTGVIAKAGGKCLPEMNFIAVSGRSFEVDADQGGRPIIVSFNDKIEAVNVRED